MTKYQTEMLVLFFDRKGPLPINRKLTMHLTEGFIFFKEKFMEQP